MPKGSVAIEAARPGRHPANHRVYIIGCICIAVTILAAGVAIWRLHQARLAEAMRDTRNLSVVLAEQTARSIQSVDLIVQDIRTMATVAGAADSAQLKARLGTEKIHDYLVDRLRSLPQASSLAVLDSDGTIVNFSRAWPVPPIDASSRDFFKYFRSHDDPGAFIGGPIVDKYDGAWAIMVTRRITGPNGEFVGVIAGVVEIRYFEDFYRAIATYSGESVTLFQRDGTMLARFPHADEMIGEPLSATSPFFKAVAAGGGTFRTPRLYRRRASHYFQPAAQRISACRLGRDQRRRSLRPMAPANADHRHRHAGRDIWIRLSVPRAGGTVPPGRGALR